MYLCFRSLTRNETGTQKWDAREEPSRQVFCAYRIGRVAKRCPPSREDSSGIWYGLRCQILCSAGNKRLEGFCVPLIYRVEIRRTLKKMIQGETWTEMRPRNLSC
jgi:hypothetical protein